MKASPSTSCLMPRFLTIGRPFGDLPKALSEASRESQDSRFLNRRCHRAINGLLMGFKAVFFRTDNIFKAVFRLLALFAPRNIFHSLGKPLTVSVAGCISKVAVSLNLSPAEIQPITTVAGTFSQSPITINHHHQPSPSTITINHQLSTFN